MENEDEIIVMVVPDYQMLEYVERIASNLSDDPVHILLFSLFLALFLLHYIYWSIGQLKIYIATFTVSNLSPEIIV